MSKMGLIIGFFFRDRWNMRGWAIFPPRMSIAEIGFVLLAAYEIVRVAIWLRS